MVYPRSGDNYVIYYGHTVSTRLGKATNKTKKIYETVFYTTSCSSHLLPVLTFRVCCPTYWTIYKWVHRLNNISIPSVFIFWVSELLLIFMGNVKAKIITNLWKPSHVIFENRKTLIWIHIQNKRIHLCNNNENYYLPSPLFFKFLRLIFVLSSLRTSFCFCPQQIKPTNNA